MAVGLFALLGTLFKGTIGSFFADFAANYLLDKSEDGMRRLVDKINWNEVGRFSNKSQGLRLIAGYLANILDGAKSLGATGPRLADAMTWVLAGLEAAAHARLSGRSERVVVEVIDEIGDLLREKLRDNDLPSTINWLREVAAGNITPGDAMTDTPTDPKGVRVRALPEGFTLTAVQRAALALVEKFLLVHCIQMDTFERRKPRHLYDDIREGLVKDVRVLNALPNKNLKWFRSASGLLDKMYREALKDKPNEKRLRAWRAEFMEKYYDGLSPFFLVCSSMADVSNGAFADLFENVLDRGGDAFDTLLTRKGRAKFKGALGTFGQLVLRYGPAAVASYLFAVVSILVLSLALSIGGLMGLIYGLNTPTTALSAGAILPAMGIVTNVLVFAKLLVTGFGRHPDETLDIKLAAAAPGALLILTSVLFASYWHPNLGTLYGPGIFLTHFMLFGALGALVLSFVLQPLDGLLEMLRTWNDPEVPGLVSQILRRAFGDTGELTIQKLKMRNREMSGIVHITTLITMITSIILIVSGQLLGLLIAVSDGERLVSALFGLVGGIFLNVEMFRRFRNLWFATRKEVMEGILLVQLREYAVTHVAFRVFLLNIFVFLIFLVQWASPGTLPGTMGASVQLVSQLSILLMVFGFVGVLGFVYRLTFGGGKLDRSLVIAGVASFALLLTGYINYPDGQIEAWWFLASSQIEALWSSAFG